MRKTSIVLALSLSLTICATIHAAITGTTVDADGKPVAGATISAYAVEGSAARRARLVAGKLDREALATTKSAENGTFSIDLKSPAAVDVTIEAPAHSPTTIATVDGDDLGMIVLGVPAPRSLRVTSGGKAVANAIVLSAFEAVQTNTSGEVPADTGLLFVVHPDYAVARREPSTATEIKLTRGVAVRGRVVKGSDPVAHAIVSVNGWPLAESADDGTFVVAHAPESWQSISAVHGSDVGSASRSKAASVEIRLTPGATFTGTLRDAKRGSVVSGARIALIGPDDTNAIALSDAKGAFTFAPLLPRAYQISGMHPAYAIDSANVAVPAMRSRAFTAQPFAKASGHVVDENHKPVAGALVSSGGNSGSARVRASLTNPAGEFAVRVVADTTRPAPIFASKRDYVTGSSPARIWKPEEVRNDIAITLVHGFVAQVRVLDRQEHPVPNAQVNVSRTASSMMERSASIACADPSLPDCHRTGADGLVSIRTVEGRHDFMVFGEDVSPVRAPNQMLTARSATVVVHVDRGVEISGRVVYADGTPVAGAVVESPTGIMPRLTTTATDGTFKISGVASGSAMVTAFSSDRRLSSTPVSVKAPANNVTITMPRGARVEGRVLDRATQQPVTDFTILLPARSLPGVMSGPNQSTGGQPIHADDGQYALDNVPPGTLQLIVHATGYVAGTRSDIAVEDGKTVSGIDIQLDRGAAVSGHVTAAGSSAAGVQVRLAFQRTAGFSNATTDADGLYTLEGLSEGDHTIEFQKQGFIVLHKPVEITAGKDQRVDADLDPGNELRGRVVDHSGQPVTAAMVAVGQGLGNSATSDGEGTFVIQGLSAGKYPVTARKEGYVSAQASDVDLPQSAPLTLTIEAGATVTGRVTGLPPEQFTQVTVVASGGTSRNQTFADASGNFSLPGLPDGGVRVDAFLNAPGQRRMASTRNIVIENGAAPLVEMNFAEGITVSGHVTKANAPLTAGNVGFIPNPPSPDRQFVSGMISQDGSYIATGLAAGDYSVRVSAPGVAFATKYTAASSSTFDIDIHGAMLRGHVVDASTGSPIASARASVSSRLPSFGAATTDSDGRFAIDALADATYNMQVTSDQYATASQQVVVANGSVPDVEVRMEQAPAVIIHLVDATSGSAVDGNVAVMDPSHAFRGQAVRIDIGMYKVWLKPGSYTASAYARGYIAKTTTFATPPADVSIALAQAGSLVIRARSAQSVRLDVPGGVPQRVLGLVQVGMNGPYDSIPPGFYLLSTIGDKGVTRSLPVTIVAGQTATIDLP